MCVSIRVVEAFLYFTSAMADVVNRTPIQCGIMQDLFIGFFTGRRVHVITLHFVNTGHSCTLREHNCH